MVNKRADRIGDLARENDAAENGPANGDQATRDQQRPDGTGRFLAFQFVFGNQALLPLHRFRGFGDQIRVRRVKLLDRVRVSASANRGDNTVVRS